MESLVDADADGVELLQHALTVVARRWSPPSRTKVAAVLTTSGRTAIGTNLRFNGHSACAEVVAVACLDLAPDELIKTIVCVGGQDLPWQIFEPCGNCRQMLIEFAPGCEVLLSVDSRVVRVPIRELLPFPYQRRGSDAFPLLRVY